MNACGNCNEISTFDQLIFYDAGLALCKTNFGFASKRADQLKISSHFWKFSSLIFHIKLLKLKLINNNIHIDQEHCFDIVIIKLIILLINLDRSAD